MFKKLSEIYDFHIFIVSSNKRKIMLTKKDKRLLH